MTKHRGLHSVPGSLCLLAPSGDSYMWPAITRPAYGMHWPLRGQLYEVRGLRIVWFGSAAVRCALAHLSALDCMNACWICDLRSAPGSLCLPAVVGDRQQYVASHGQQTECTGHCVASFVMWGDEHLVGWPCSCAAPRRA